VEVIHELVIKQLDQLNDDSGVVKYICYELISSTEGRSVKLSGFIELNTDEIEDFISYEDLTEEVILEWTYTYNFDKIEKQKLMNVERLNAILSVTVSSTKKQHLPWEPELAIQQSYIEIIAKNLKS
jgi:hypothetical protein